MSAAKFVAGKGSAHAVLSCPLSYESIRDVEFRDEGEGPGALVGAGPVMRYRAEAVDGTHESSRWAVGVYDAASGVVEFREAEAFGLRARPKRERAAATGDGDEDIGWFEKNVALADAFGTKKKQRQLRAIASNRVDAATTFGSSALESTLGALGDAAAAKAAAPAPAPAAALALAPRKAQFRKRPPGLK